MPDLFNAGKKVHHSKMSSPRRERVGVRTHLDSEKSLSTLAEDGRVVL